MSRDDLLALVSSVIAAAADGELDQLQAIVLGDAFQHDLAEQLAREIA